MPDFSATLTDCLPFKPVGLVVFSLAYGLLFYLRRPSADSIITNNNK